MEKFDKNYIIGILLMFLMYSSYMYFYKPLPTKPEPTAKPAISNIKGDTLAKVENKILVKDTSNSKPEKIASLSNKDITYDFSTRGGSLKKVVLNQYKSYQKFITNSKEPLVIFDGNRSSIDLQVPNPTGMLSINSLNFEISEQKTESNPKTPGSLVFTANLPTGGKIIKTYSIKPAGFELLESVKMISANGTPMTQSATLVWNNAMQILENDLAENRKVAQINYYDKEENFEDLGLGSVSDNEEKAELPVKWFSFKQKYFTSGIVSEGSDFEKSNFVLKTPTTDSTIVKMGTVTCQIPAQDFAANKVSFKYYFGPNDLNHLNAVSPGFVKNLYLGYDIVKPINRYVFVPLFKWVESFVSNYGLLIILVVLIIKTVLTPLIYKSYVSSAKMRILGPEVAAIKEKVGDDAMKVQQETMKLYQQVGVSPLSGCVPLVLQMPILMSVFFLFPNMVMFRQKGFLWSHDLSTYDAPLSWSSHLPIIGNHISLFVVLMTLSSLAFTYYNNQITPDQPGPIDMKKLSYIFPLVFFFVLNSFPAALSFYYLVSNLVTIAQQLIVRKFIDEDKIKEILDKNRKNFATKPQKKNKFGDFIQKQLQASEEMRKNSEEQKNSRKKK